MKYDSEQLKSEIAATFQRESDVVIRQLNARDLTMTSVGLANFEVELREIVHKLAISHSKSIRNTSTIL